MPQDKENSTSSITIRIPSPSKHAVGIFTAIITAISGSGWNIYENLTNTDTQQASYELFSHRLDELYDRVDSCEVDIEAMARFVAASTSARERLDAAQRELSSPKDPLGLFDSPKALKVKYKNAKLPEFQDVRQRRINIKEFVD